MTHRSPHAHPGFAGVKRARLRLRAFPFDIAAHASPRAALASRFNPAFFERTDANSIPN
ncbi:hypothetical protein ACRUKS_23965 [Burkholderia pseudomallei]|uniref:hypothetical protein n=1 Tax=Burkholderia pseudomallei TaxID=28450 RepID=UPI0001A485CE|nr:hypothetical protein [Burkholderia pseudomallei]ACQ95481.1 hypothetical protein GBP346_A0469 [Burkholderia pseudomallei MSHR346]MBF3542995.1 hypothetical protein [Burkholderia pseudomallei]MBF3604873.1 hypothetical protein [Burkholderia pseudomallei]MBF3912542.1 hypothetical protein [Burkholderia pseudomallei]MDV2188563.1 hypothetical protein [Burkholderia pseudomallei]